MAGMPADRGSGAWDRIGLVMVVAWTLELASGTVAKELYSYQDSDTQLGHHIDIRLAHFRLVVVPVECCSTATYRLLRRN